MHIIHRCIYVYTGMCAYVYVYVCICIRICICIRVCFSFVSLLFLTQRVFPTSFLPSCPVFAPEAKDFLQRL